jgi:ABC-type transporter Mla subunit MlaD
MQRVQIQLTDEQLNALRKYADAKGEGMAALVRQAVDIWISNETRRDHVDRALEAIGGFHSGLGDLAERHDAYIDEAPG